MKTQKPHSDTAKPELSTDTESCSPAEPETCCEPAAKSGYCSPRPAQLSGCGCR